MVFSGAGLLLFARTSLFPVRVYFGVLRLDLWLALDLYDFLVVYIDLLVAVGSTMICLEVRGLAEF